MKSNPLTRGLPATHPGEILRETVLPALGRPKTEIAQLLGVSRRSLYDILDEKRPVTNDMAHRIGKLVGNGPTLWLNLQQAWDLEHVPSELAGALENIPTLQAAEAA